MKFTHSHAALGPQDTGTEAAVNSSSDIREQLMSLWTFPWSLPSLLRVDTEALLTFATKTVPDGVSGDAGAEPTILTRNHLWSPAVLTQPQLASADTLVAEDKA